MDLLHLHTQMRTSTSNRLSFAVHPPSLTHTHCSPFDIMDDLRMSDKKWTEQNKRVFSLLWQVRKVEGLRGKVLLTAWAPER